MVTLNINGRQHTVDAAPDMPLLWALRDLLSLTGTKYGCGVAACGACTVHIDGVAQRSCVIPVSAAANRAITTIEGLDSPTGKAVQQAWNDLSVPQCGYCQSGQIMAATSLLAQTPNPTDEQIADQMAGNVCRCCAYARIKKAVRQAADRLGS